MRPARRTVAIVVGGAIAIGGCSFIVPFSDYDRAFGAGAGPGDSADDAVDAIVPTIDGTTPTCTDSSEDCGECRHSCLGGACASGKCLVEKVASVAATDIVGIALDSDQVYGVGIISFFGDFGVVGRARKDEKSATIVQLAAHAGRPVRIAVRGTNLYFTSAGPNANIVGHARTDGDGGSVPDAGVLYVQSAPFAIAANDTTLAWTNTPGSGDVWRAARQVDAGAAVAFAGPGAVAIALDGSAMYWTISGAEGSVMRANLDGSGATPVVATTPWPTYLAVDDGFVYWTANAPGEVAGAVMRAPKTGGTATTLASALATPGAIAVDESRVYWTSGLGVSRVNKDGSGKVLELASSLDNRDIAVDSSHVYWTAKKDNESAHEIRRVPK